MFTPVQLLSWPSGLRRSTQVRVRPAGVGSNPTGSTIFATLPSLLQKCFRPGSNRRPWDYETHALPTAPRKQMRHPGIEPGAPRWQRGILPLNQWRFHMVSVVTKYAPSVSPPTPCKNGVRSGIRTHAPEETGALNQRLRPLGHPNTVVVKSGSPGMDSNHRPRDRCCYFTNYSPPLYQLSYREVTTLRGITLATSSYHAPPRTPQGKKSSPTGS